MFPGLRVAGLDVSAYALGQAMDDVAPVLVRGTAERLPFADRTFDLVVSINTAAQPRAASACIAALGEIERVGRRHATSRWTPGSTRSSTRSSSAGSSPRLTYSDPEGWRRLFREAGYTGDYYWTLTE